MFLQKVKANYQIIVASSLFIQQMNSKCVEMMRSPEFQKRVIKDAIMYREGFTDDEVLERAFDELYPEWMMDLERRGTFQDNKLEVYRGISVKDKKDIDFKDIGQYWTWDKTKANNYSDKNTSLPLYVATALISIPDINMPDTLAKIVWAGYTLEESEREMTLKVNVKPIKVEST